MIHPLLSHGKILFVERDCGHCAIYKKFIFQLNNELKLDKQIKIIDCTNYDKLGVRDSAILKLFEPYLESYPTLFYEGERIEGANSLAEAKSWLTHRLILDNAFVFERMPEYLPLIKKWCLFHKSCRYVKGRIVCQ